MGKAEPCDLVEGDALMRRLAAYFWLSIGSDAKHQLLAQESCQSNHSNLCLTSVNFPQQSLCGSYVIFCTHLIFQLGAGNAGKSTINQ